MPRESYVVEANQAKVVIHNSDRKFFRLITVTLERKAVEDPFRVTIETRYPHQPTTDQDQKIEFCSLEEMHNVLAGMATALEEYNQKAAATEKLKATPL
jgi:predicted transcriptional regulator